MSYGTIGSGGNRDPEFGRPEEEDMTQMDKAKLPKPGDNIVYGVKQIPNFGKDPDTSVSGLLGPSDAEKTLAKQVLSGFLTNYANAMIRVQYSNKAMRDWTKFAVDSKKDPNSPEVRKVIDGFKDIATEGIAQMKRIRPHLDVYAKSDIEIWDKLAAMEKAFQDQITKKGAILPNTVNVKTVKGTEFVMTPRTGGVAGQVGVEPVTIAILVIVTISVLAIAAAAVGYMIKQTAVLTAENRASASAKKTYDELSKSQFIIQKAQEDKAAGKITETEMNQIITTEQKFQEKVVEINKQATESVNKAKAGSIPWAPIAVGVAVVALGYVAWKKGWLQSSMKALQGGGLAGNLIKNGLAPK